MIIGWENTNRIFPGDKPRATLLHTIWYVTQIGTDVSEERTASIFHTGSPQSWSQTFFIIFKHFFPTRGLLLYPEDGGSIFIIILRSGWPWSTPNIWAATPAIRKSRFITEGPSKKLFRCLLILDLLTSHCPLRRHLHVMGLSNKRDMQEMGRRGGILVPYLSSVPCSGWAWAQPQSNRSWI
jgi:hypothetical protein